MSRMTSRLARPLLTGVLLVLAGLLVYLGHRPSEQSGGDFQRYNNRQFMVSRVIDGDTIVLEAPDGDKATTTVRLWGVDTPETKAPGKPVAYFGPQATEFTRNMVAGRMVSLELEPENTRGKFGRLLGFVYTDKNEMLNEELLGSGHGYVDLRWRHRFYFRFQQVENQARKNKRGLWRQVKLEQMPGHVRRRLSPQQ